MGGLVFVVGNKWLITLIHFQFFLDEFWEKISIPGLAEQYVSMFTHAVNDHIALCLCLCTHWTQFYCAKVQCALIENVVDAMAAVAAVMTFAKISRVSFTFPSQNNEGGKGEQSIQFFGRRLNVCRTKSSYWSAIYKKLLNEMEEHAVRSRILSFKFTCVC